MIQVLFVVAALLAAVFAAVLGRRYVTRRSPFYAWWTLSFGLYVVALVVEAVTVGGNWHQVWEYQVYMVASAGLVGAMSAGTVHLAWPRTKLARGYALYVSGVGLALIGLTIAYPPLLQGTWAQLNGGQGAIVGAPRVAYLLLSAVGGPIVVLASLGSWFKTRRYYPLFIAVGALIPSLAGTMASQGLGMSGFPLLNMVGLVLIFIGYLYSQPKASPKTSRLVPGRAAAESHHILQ